MSDLNMRIKVGASSPTLPMKRFNIASFGSGRGHTSTASLIAGSCVSGDWLRGSILMLALGPQWVAIFVC